VEVLLLGVDLWLPLEPLVVIQLLIHLLLFYRGQDCLTAHTKESSSKNFRVFHGTLLCYLSRCMKKLFD
jgi:hypothetical protein